VFNSTTTQKGQFVSTVRQGNWLRRLRIANEIQCILPINNVTHFTVKHSSYTNTVTGNLIVYLLAHYYVSAFTNTKPDLTHPI